LVSVRPVRYERTVARSLCVSSGYTPENVSGLLDYGNERCRHVSVAVLARGMGRRAPAIGGHQVRHRSRSACHNIALASPNCRHRQTVVRRISRRGDWPWCSPGGALRTYFLRVCHNVQTVGRCVLASLGAESSDVAVREKGQVPRGPKGQFRQSRIGSSR
jgi:hypothetical protein